MREKKRAQRMQSAVNLKTKQRKNVELRVGDWCYPRGLAVGPDYFLVGLSFMGPKKRRKEADHFYVATIKDMKIVDMRKITRSFCSGAMGQIFEIRLLDELDKAHNGLKGS